MIKIPNAFVVKTNHEYPPGNNQIFEHYFYERFKKENPNTIRKYLPILWTNFYISRNYAQSDMTDLQKFLDQLSKKEKYFTIIQWDDGIINNIKDLNILSFSSGGVGNYAIPLINQPHAKIERNRDIFASFVGVINGRHKIREQMLKICENNSNYLIKEKTSFGLFKEIMERSIFALCPRGYGKTSFRINEALNLGAIPVYIYDDPWIPFNDLINFEDYGILISNNELHNMDKILNSYSEKEIMILRENGKKIYNDYFIYSSCYERIIECLQKN